MDFSPLPIDAALPRLTAALRANNVAVLVAPPGAGKTTRIPLILANEEWAAGRRILVLEPRRLAARAAADRMARTLGERVGGKVGLRVRFDTRVSRDTVIEIITEGIFTRLLLDDPALDGVAAVILDEFHERSLDTDLGLALARDAQQGLREDLRLLIMSATIDGARIGKLLGDAPLIESQGRAFAVETRYAGRDTRPIEPQMADTIARAMRADTGSLLAFLPGTAEIHRTRALLEGRTEVTTDVVMLYGALSVDEQDRAIAPAPPGRRKIVLATAIAETSITIEGVRIVVDSGLARVPRYEPDVGVTRLETVRVSRATADQRRGRAGRVEPGVCYRLWDEPQTAALESYPKPEILAADLSSFTLDLAAWGSAPEQLTFIDPPPLPALVEAKSLLIELGALDSNGRITAEGRKLRRLPVPPRLARMIADAAGERSAHTAARIAMVVSERGLGGFDVDLRERLNAFRNDRSPRASSARTTARNWAMSARHDAVPARAASPSDLAIVEQEDEPPGSLVALAYPERIAKNRGSGSCAFLLVNGRGATIDPASPLAREPYLAVAELTGTAAASRILIAAPITLAEIESRFADRIEVREEVIFDTASAGLRGRRSRRLGAVVLVEQPTSVEPNEDTARKLAAGIVAIGIDQLAWTRPLQQWRDRVMFLRASDRRAVDNSWPDLSDAALGAGIDAWLTPLLTSKLALSDVTADELERALSALLPWAQRRRLDVEAPTHFEAPTGSHVPIDYNSEGGPKIAIRVQELFGLDRHPAIAGGRIPLSIELLSPAHRPVQTTRDLPGFWRGSYAAVRADMRGRYPKHPWPEDPLGAPPTRRAKPRKS